MPESDIDQRGKQLAHSPDHEKRMAAATRRAQWELGSGGWAGTIIGAYLYPDANRENLEAERG